MSARQTKDKTFVYNRILKAIKIEPGLTNWQLSQRFGSRTDLFHKARKELGVADPKSEYLTESDLRKAKCPGNIGNRINFGKRAR